MAISLFKRTQRIFFLKIISLLSIVRWYNIIITAVAQYVSAIYVFNRTQSGFDVLRSPDLHLIVLATALIISAGYIINSFYDLEKDLINRPEQTIFGRLVSKSFCLYCYLTFNVIALALALFVSLNVFIFFALFAAALWSYSHKFQRYAILRELSASLLSVASVLVIALYFNFLSEDLAIYAVLMMLILFNKEIIKDFINLKGDELYGYGTIPIRFGKRAAFYWIAGFSMFAIAIAFYFMTKHTEMFFELGMFIAILLLIWVVALFKTPDKTSNKFSNNLYKILIVLTLALSAFL